jgi:hypothetical protein
LTSNHLSHNGERSNPVRDFGLEAIKLATILNVDGLYPPVKLESHRMTYSVLLQQKPEKKSYKVKNFP